MPNYLLVISNPTSRTAHQVEVTDPVSRALLGLKIGDELDASILGLQGRIKITGGSDIAGTPMRPDVIGPGKRYVLLSAPPGFIPSSKGERKRKLVRGNVITEDIRQINAVLLAKEEKKEKPGAPPMAEKEVEEKLSLEVRPKEVKAGELAKKKTIRKGTRKFRASSNVGPAST